jgi:hypothetical protein
MRIEISRSGEVDGAYPRRDGILRGRMSANGDIHGLWTQPRSDHPCREPRGGTYAWGAFEINGIYDRHPSGSWGYCGERADRDWELRRDR